MYDDPRKNTAFIRTSEASKRIGKIFDKMPAIEVRAVLLWCASNLIVEHAKKPDIALKEFSDDLKGLIEILKKQSNDLN